MLHKLLWFISRGDAGFAEAVCYMPILCVFEALLSQRSVNFDYYP